jgi:hypothetical protein
MVAMKAATDAAGDMITTLTRQYNRARQTHITLELLDIVGGANAIRFSTNQIVVISNVNLVLVNAAPVPGGTNPTPTTAATSTRTPTAVATNTSTPTAVTTSSPTPTPGAGSALVTAQKVRTISTKIGRRSRIVDSLPRPGVLLPWLDHRSPEA